MTGVISGVQLFPNNNIWNTDISAQATLSNSSTYISSIGGTLYTNTWNDGASGFPFNVVDSSQAFVTIHLGLYAANSDSGPYPIPPTAVHEAGSDKHCIVLDTGNNRLYEMYQAVKQGDNSWNADSGAIFDLTSNTLRTDGYLSADAAGLPMLPGLLRYDEVASGVIDHAVRLLVNATQNTHLWPARHDAGTANSALPPMGTCLRLKSSFDISGFSSKMQVILRALKKYGGYIADNTGVTGLELCGVPDSRWSSADLSALATIATSNFEAVDVSSLQQSSSSAATSTLPVTTSAIYTENQLPGSTGWQFTLADHTQLQCYSDQKAYNPGDTVSFLVSVKSTPRTWTLTIYRLGYYGGTGGCLKHTSAVQTGVAQGYWDGTTLQNCPTAIIDNTTHNCEAGWAITDTWSIPTAACTGLYLAVVTDNSGYQTGCTFVVRQPGSTADFAYIHPTLTDAAYNAWGGYSLYTSPTVGVKVSLNRPDYTNFGTGQNTLYYELAFLKWAESQGYDMAYITDVDVHGNAALLTAHKCVLYAGHTEYWTKAMRDNAEAAISAGVSAAFLGANGCWWQVRLENDNAGNANRTVVCYKVRTADGNLALDPQDGVNNAIVTTHWDDALIGRPPYTMIGLQYGSLTNAGNIAWMVQVDATHPVLNGTGLTKGSSYGSDLVGNEYDKKHPLSPSNYQLLSTTPLVATGGFSDNANTIIYTASSGAVVFATGSLALTWALDSYRYGASSVAAIAGIQTMFVNIMTTLSQVRNQKKFSMVQL